MADTSSPTIWISGSQLVPEVAKRCRQALEEASLRVMSVQQLEPGTHLAVRVSEEIAKAQGIILLLCSGWTTQVAATEGQPLLEQCRAEGVLWILDVEAALDPPALRPILQQQTHRLPRDGKCLSQLSPRKQAEVLEELRRSITARLELPTPHDAQYRQLQEYRSSQKQRLETVPLKGFFAAQHPTSARSFHFSELFVQPRLEWLRLPADIEAQYRHLETQLKNDKLTSGERWKVENQRYELASRYKIEQPQSLAEALRRFPQIMLLGKPGSGKSSILHHLALHAHVSDSSLAVLIKLHTIAEKLRFGESLWQHVRQKLRSEYKVAISTAFEEWADQGRGLLLLDGVDEVRKEHRQPLLQAVGRMLLERPKLRCIVTSRLATDCWLDHRIPHLQVADLNQDEIASFVQKHKRCEDRATAEAQSERLIKSLSAGRALGELAHNPLSLRLLCLLDHGPDGLPLEIAELYERAVCTLLETWPANRVARKVLISTANLRQALASTAAWMHQRGQREVKRVELLRQLASSLNCTKARTAEQLAAHCLDVATVHSGILVESSPDKFEFLHLTFTEYLAADQYVQIDNLAELAAQRSDSRYKETISFAAGILAHVQRRREAADTFLRCLSAEAPGSLDRLLHPNLPLATTCLGDGTRYSPDLIDELLGTLLRAATIPLGRITEAAERVLAALRVPASLRIIDACAALLHHPLDSLRLAVVRFVARNTVDQATAQALCQKFVADWNDEVACLAALGVIRAGKFPEEGRYRSAARLAFCFHKDIVASDEVEHVLRTIPRLLEVVEERYGVENPRYQTEAARLLTLLRPHDWELWRLLLSKGSEEDKLAIARAALLSEPNAERLVDLFLEQVRPATIPRPSSESILQGLFADSPAVRRRFLFHFRRPLSEANYLSRREAPEQALTAAAATFLKEVAGSGDEKKRCREVLLHDLRELLANADTDLCRRIATLGAAVGATSSWLADALGPCIQADGAIRVWAIDTAFQHKLYSLAVTGALLRAEKPGCMAAVVVDIKNRLHRGNGNQPILSALEDLPATELRDTLRLLCRVATDQEPLDKLYPLLFGGPGSVPLPLCWWVASEIALRTRRTNGQVPAALLGAILALANTRWPEPPDLKSGIPEGSRPPSWLPRHHTFSEFIHQLDDADLPLPAQSASQVTDLVHEYIRWLREVIAAGADLGWQEPERHLRWLREAVTTNIVLLDQIIDEMAHPEPGVREVASWLLPRLYRSDREHLREGDKPDPSSSAARELIRDRIFHALERKTSADRWSMVKFLTWHGIGGNRLRPVLSAFLSEEHPLQLRWKALMRLNQSEASPSSPERAVIRDGLASDDYALRLEAVEQTLARAVPDLNCVDALKPLFEPGVRASIRLHAATFWLRLPDADPGVVRPILIGLLACLDPAGEAIHHRASATLNRLIGTQAESAQRRPEDDRLTPYKQETGVGFWATALLSALGGHEDALRGAAAGWLNVLPTHDEDGLPAPWSERRNLALSLLARVGVGDAEPAVDQVLLGMLLSEGDHPHTSFYWMKRLRRVSQPMLEHLLPIILRDYYDADKAMAEWVMELAEQDSRVRGDLAAALLSAIRDPQPPARYYTQNLLLLLLKFSLIDDIAAEFFVSAVARRSLTETPGQDQLAMLAPHPIIHRHLLSALQAYTPYECMWIVDWLVPIRLLTSDDGKPIPAQSADVLNALRAWLEHADYGLRFEAGERLYRLGYRDEEVMRALRSCLHAPLAWFGTYYGDGIRRTVARLLLDLREISPAELLDSMLPILSAKVNDTDVEGAIELLARVEACHKSALEAVKKAWLETQGSVRRRWPIARQIFRLGPSTSERLSLILGVLAEERSYLSEVKAELPQLLGLGKAPSVDDNKSSSGSDSLSRSRERFRFGPLQGASILAELSAWPEELLGLLATAIAYSTNDLRVLEEVDDSLAPTKVVELLEPLLHHPPEEEAMARMVRHACLLRFGNLVGITVEHLPYALTG